LLLSLLKREEQSATCLFFQKDIIRLPFRVEGMSESLGKDDETSNVTFKVIFKPKSFWADRVYLGNMLIEILGMMVQNTSAFDFEVEALEQSWPLYKRL